MCRWLVLERKESRRWPAEVQVEFLGRDDPRWLAGGRWLAATLAESVKTLSGDRPHARSAR